MSSARWELDVTNRAYHEGQGVSSSWLKKYLSQTPAAIKNEMDNPKQPTPAMLLGSAMHALLESETVFHDEFSIMPELNLRTKNGREKKLEFEAQNKNRSIIKYEVYEKAKLMADKLKRHPVVEQLTEGALLEQSVYWWDEKSLGGNGVLCKARPDVLSIYQPLILDYKTCQNASYGFMQREILKRHYHLSAAMYLRGVNCCEELLQACSTDQFKGFCLLCIESEPPYEIACYELSGQMLEEGEVLLDIAIERYFEACIGNWPSYPPYLRVIDPPRYSIEPAEL